MSDRLEELKAKRESLKEQDRELMEAMKVERRAISDKKKAEKVNASNVSFESYEKLRRDNANMRRLVSLLKKADGSTYKQVGEFMDISPARARQLAEEGARVLRKLGSEQKQ